MAPGKKEYRSKLISASKTSWHEEKREASHDQKALRSTDEVWESKSRNHSKIPKMNRTMEADEARTRLRCHPSEPQNQLEAFERWITDFKVEAEEFRSAALLSKIKLDSASEFAPKRLDGSTDRVRLSATLFCLEHLLKSMRGEAKTVIRECVEELLSAVFTGTVADAHDSTWSELVRNFSSKTYSERANELFRVKRELELKIKDLETMQESLVRQVEKSRHQNALELFHNNSPHGLSRIPSMIGEDSNGIHRKNSIFNDITMKDSMVAAFAQLDAEIQSKLLDTLCAKAKLPPPLELALSVYARMSDEDRHRFSELLKSKRLS